jgi:hypothetical protein
MLLLPSLLLPVRRLLSCWQLLQDFAATVQDVMINTTAESSAPLDTASGRQVARHPFCVRCGGSLDGQALQQRDATGDCNSDGGSGCSVSGLASGEHKLNPVQLTVCACAGSSLCSYAG